MSALYRRVETGRAMRTMGHGVLGLEDLMGCLGWRELRRMKRWRLWVYIPTMTGDGTSPIGRIEGVGG